MLSHWSLNKNLKNKVNCVFLLYSVLHQTKFKGKAFIQHETTQKFCLHTWTHCVKRVIRGGFQHNAK